MIGRNGAVVWQVKQAAIDEFATSGLVDCVFVPFLFGTHLTKLKKIYSQIDTKQECRMLGET